MLTVECVPHGSGDETLAAIAGAREGKTPGNHWHYVTDSIFVHNKPVQKGTVKIEIFCVHTHVRPLHSALFGLRKLLYRRTI